MPRATLVFPVLLAIGLRAQSHDADVWFLVATRSAMTGIQTLDPPSLNARGDLVVRRIKSAGRDLVVFRDADQKVNNGSTAAAVVVGSTSSSWILNRFPVVNATGLVARFTLSSGFTTVGRHAPPSYAYTRIARGGPSTLPFTFLSPILDLDGSDRLTFYGEWGTRTPFKAIFRSATEVTSPLAAPKIATTQGGGFSDLEAYVDASTDGAHVVFRGVSPTAGSGVYANQVPAAVATDRTGWSDTGVRPATNGNGVVAFYGKSSSREGVFLWSGGAAPITRLAGSIGQQAGSPARGSLPASYSRFDRLATNDLNQVAFVAVDGNGKRALYSTNLGVMRSLLAVGDTLSIGARRAEVTGISHWDSLTDSGQIGCQVDVKTAAGADQWLLRRNRASYQTKVRESPVRPSWWDADKTKRVGYLLRSVANSGKPFDQRFTIASAGCNLTSTANLLTFYGFPVTPIGLQDWLVTRWQAAPTEAAKNRYIRRVSNDFAEDFVLWYTLERAAVTGPSLVVEFVGIHRNSSTSGRENLARVVQSLRAGDPVKLRVPNGSATGYRRFGHYVLAYGLKDPNRIDAAMTLDDVLIHDPGNSGMLTLGDYGRKKGYDAIDPGWFEQNRTRGSKPAARYRVYLYRTTPITRLPAWQPITSVYVASPVEVLITDPRGRRLGLDPTRGAFREIPGGDFYEEDSYHTLDSESPEERVWTKPGAAKWLRLPTALVGDYRIEIAGTGNGPYELHLSGGDQGFEQQLVQGIATPNLRRVVEVSRLPAGVRGIGVSTPACRGPVRATTLDVPTTPNAGFTLRCRAAPPNGLGVLGIALPLEGGFRVVGLDVYLDLAKPSVFVPVTADGNGAAATPLPIPAGLQKGAAVAVQYFWRNTASCQGAGPWSASQALELRLR